MKLAAAGQFSQEFVAADAFGFHLQSSRRHAAQSLRVAARSRQLLQIHALQFSSDLIDGARQKLCTYFCLNFATRPLRLCFAHIELEVVEGPLRDHLVQLQLLLLQVLYLQLAFRIHAADELTRRRAWRCSSQKRRKQPLEPVRPRSWTTPAIQIRRGHLVYALAKVPLRPISRIARRCFLDVSGPHPAKAFHFYNTCGATTINPIQFTLRYLQWLV